MGTRLISDHAVDQAERELASRILTGKYRDGERLPSREALMEELGISFPTLGKAMGRLRARRLVRFEPGVGVVAVSLIEFVGLEMLWPMISHCDEPSRRWVLLCQFYDFIRPLLVDWAERTAISNEPDQLEWFAHYTTCLEDRRRLKFDRADIGQVEYDLARVLAATAGNICFTMTMNPLLELFRSDALVQGTDTIVPPETYREMLNALRERDSKRAGALLEAALWKRQAVCIEELRKLGWSATGGRLDVVEDTAPEAA